MPPHHHQISAERCGHFCHNVCRYSTLEEDLARGTCCQLKCLHPHPRIGRDLVLQLVIQRYSIK